jgi:HKD family nuclease
MKLITNHSNTNHYQALKNLLQDADEVFLATAFLKTSGLNKLFTTIEALVIAEKKVRLIAGQNFALTEPSALHRLRALFINSNNCKLYLAHANNPKEIFHPKLSLIRKGTKAYILSGSSNITDAGLTSNFESSLLIECNVADEIWENAIDYFNVLVSPRVSLPVTLFILRRYEKYFNSQNAHNSKSKPVPEKTELESEFDYDKLLVHFNIFNNINRATFLEKRQREYNQAKNILDQIANEALTREEFSNLLDQLVGTKDTNRLWHSGSLFRLRRSVYPHYKKFRKLIQFIKSNQAKSISFIFDGAKKIVREIKGAAANYVTEIMMTYNPTECANINRNPITVLKQVAGVNLKAHSSSFNGKDYEEYCILIKDISELLTISNMLEADTFFNDIYWKIYSPKSKK